MKRILLSILLWVFAINAFAEGIPFPGPGLSAATRTVVITPTANNTNTTTTASVTFTAQSIGTVSPDRVVLVAVFARTAVGTGGPITGVTINAGGGTCNGATSMTSLVTDPGNATNGVRLGIFGLLCTTGTTADITVSTSGNSNRIGISVYSMTGTDGTTTVTSKSGATETASNPIITTGSILIPNHGGAVGISATTGGSSTGTWSVLATTDINADITGNRWTVAHTSNGSASNSVVQVSYAVITDIKDLVVASW